MKRTRWQWTAGQAGRLLVLGLGLLATEALAQLCAYSKDTGEKPVDHNFGLFDLNATVSPPD